MANSNAVELILDGSGTMGQLLPTGQSRWEAARDAMLALAEGQVFPSGLPVALRVRGHVQPLSCEMRLEVPLEPFDEPNLGRGRVNGDAVAVPAVVYRVQVYSSPGRVLEGVEVRERDVALAVGLRGG